MVEIRFEVDTALSPQQIRAAATDFSERRPRIWSGIDPKRFTVHALGDSTAEVTEGSREFGGIWARERYDWSDPHLVVAWVLETPEQPVGAAGPSWARGRQPGGVGLAA
jgi:hypothetical protein